VRPRQLGAAERQLLEHLAALTIDELELRGSGARSQQSCASRWSASLLVSRATNDGGVGRD